METQKHQIGYEDYKDRQRWAEKKAKELGVVYTKGTDYFEVVSQGENKEEIRTRLPLWDSIPTTDANGKPTGSVPIEKAIEATKRFPKMSLPQAVQALQE
ncbi:MAG: hypothetical protein WC730_03725 [Patescibacteria group bacterium]|jgi:hypothetical protein